MDLDAHAHYYSEPRRTTNGLTKEILPVDKISTPTLDGSANISATPPNAPLRFCIAHTQTPSARDVAAGSDVCAGCGQLSAAV